MTALEAARKWGVTKPTIVKWIRQGRLEAVKVDSPLVNGGWYWEIPDHAKRPEPRIKQ